MTIINYTFFSPKGTEFPVSSNADAKLYTMLSGMELNTFRRKDWVAPVDTALNRQYTNTSLVVAGRYFELSGETVALKASATNYVHANIDLANTTSPVSISVETSDNSNDTDINNKSGVIKRAFDVLTTNAMGVVGQTIPVQTTNLDTLTANKITSKEDTNWANVTLGTGVNRPSASLLRWRIKNGYLVIQASEIQTTIDSNGSKLLGTLPNTFNFVSQFVGTAWTGNAMYPWRVRLTGNGIYLHSGEGIRSNNITFLITYPLD